MYVRRLAEIPSAFLSSEVGAVLPRTKLPVSYGRLFDGFFR